MPFPQTSPGNQQIIIISECESVNLCINAVGNEEISIPIRSMTVKFLISLIFFLFLIYFTFSIHKDIT